MNKRVSPMFHIMFAPQTYSSPNEKDNMMMTNCLKMTWRFQHHTQNRARTHCGGTPRPDPSNMSKLEFDMALKEWRVRMKAFTYAEERQLRKSMGSKTDSEVLHPGVLIEQFFTMTDVQYAPLMVGHTFPHKEVLH